jgi:hypothetical protein
LSNERHQARIQEARIFPRLFDCQSLHTVAFPSSCPDVSECPPTPPRAWRQSPWPLLDGLEPEPFTVLASPDRILLPRPAAQSHAVLAPRLRESTSAATNLTSGRSLFRVHNTVPSVLRHCPQIMQSFLDYPPFNVVSALCFWSYVVLALVLVLVLDLRLKSPRRLRPR